MGLEAAVTNLRQTLDNLAQVVGEVQWCAVEGRPKRGDSVLIDLVDSAAQDLAAHVKQAPRRRPDAEGAGPPPRS